jgi:hypothetical protein
MIMAALAEPQLTASHTFAGEITLDVFANACSLLAFGAHACTEPTSVAAREFKHRERVRNAMTPYPIACVDGAPVRARTSLSRTRLRIGRALIYDRRQGDRARRARCRVACRAWARQSGGRLELPGTARAVLTLSVGCGSNAADGADFGACGAGDLCTAAPLRVDRSTVRRPLHGSGPRVPAPGSILGCNHLRNDRDLHRGIATLTYGKRELRPVVTYGQCVHLGGACVEV